jgi:predicted permease
MGVDDRRDADLQREIASHLEREAEEHVAAGLSPDEARLAALRAFGNVTRTREEARAVWVRAWLDDARQDLRYAWRVFARTPAFTIGAALILALGVGASAAIVGAIKAVVLAPLPYAQPDRLVRLWQNNPARQVDRFSVSLPLYRDWRSQSRSWVDLAAMKHGGVTLQTADGPEHVPAAFVTANLLPLLGIPPALGRGFRPEEDTATGPPAAILSDHLWRRAFAADAGAVGRSITIEGRAHMVVGVAQPISFGEGEFDVLLPLAPFEEDRRGQNDLDVYGRLRSDVTLEQAAAEMAGLARRLGQDLPADRSGWGVTVRPLADVVVGAPVRQRLYLLLAAVGALLLIACANLSSLLLVRTSARSREMAIRAAIGGGRGRIVRQLLTESLLLAAIGGVAALAVASGSMRALRTTVMADLPRAADITLDPWLLLVMGGVSVLAGVSTGLAPARHVSRLNVPRGLHERSQTAATDARRTRNALVVGQLALSIVLLAASGLMMRTLRQLTDVDLGFAPDRVVIAQVAPRADPEAFVETLVTRIRRLPGVVGAGATSDAPMSPRNTSLNVFPVGPARIATTESVQSDFRVVTAGYFRAMQTAILAGRDFSPRDHGDAPKVIIVNETLARSVWGDLPPIGRQLDLGGGGGEPATVVGLVQDARNHDPAQAPRPTYYASAYRGIWGAMTLVLRTTTPADALVAQVRAEVTALDPSLPLFDVGTLEGRVAAQLAPLRVVAGLLGVFASLALVLALVGVYAVMASVTGQRTREVGIRLALGAQRRDVLWSLMRDGAIMVGAGAVVGLLIALPVTRLMRGLLAGVSPFDPLTFGAATALLITASLAACWLPARRAARVDPVRTLRGPLAGGSFGALDDQLAARRADVAPAALAHRHGDAAIGQLARERVHLRVRRPRERDARRLVQRQQVHLGAHVAQQASQPARVIE